MLFETALLIGFKNQIFLPKINAKSVSASPH